MIHLHHSYALMQEKRTHITIISIKIAFIQIYHIQPAHTQKYIRAFSFIHSVFLSRVWPNRKHIKLIMRIKLCIYICMRMGIALYLPWEVKTRISSIFNKKRNLNFVIIQTCWYLSLDTEKKIKNWNFIT